LNKTNLTKDERAKVIQTAKEAKFCVVGYYFRASLEESLKRNATREGKARIPDKGVHGSHSRLQLPSFDEGFDELFYVQIDETTNSFVVEEWHEV